MPYGMSDGEYIKELESELARLKEALYELSDSRVYGMSASGVALAALAENKE